MIEITDKRAPGEVSISLYHKSQCAVIKNTIKDRIRYSLVFPGFGLNYNINEEKYEDLIADEFWQGNKTIKIEINK